MTFSENLQLLPYLLPVMVVSLTLHELAHGYTALALGDPTARQQGRLSPNPLRHLDPLGTAALIFTFLFAGFMFGWAKPVPVLPSNFRNHKWGMAVVAVAGPLTNFAIALIVIALLVRGVIPLGDERVQRIVVLTIELNIVLGVFNLFPIPPLDGSRIVGMFMPDHVYLRWADLDRFAALFLLVLLVSPLRTPFQTLLTGGMDHARRALVYLATGGGVA